MNRPAPGKYGHHVETQRKSGIVRLSRQPEIGRAVDPPFRYAADSVHRLAKRRPRLHLDDQHQISAAGDQVDLAELRAVAPVDDPLSLEHQRERRQPFAAMAETVGGKAPGAPGIG